MSIITKEQAKDLRNAFECWQQDYDPVEDKEQYDMFGLGMVAMDTLFASLEAEPVAYVSQSNLDALKRGHNDVFVKRTDDVARPVPLFTTPPAPVSVPDYPETLPCPVMLEPGLRFGKGVNTRTMLGALQRRAEHYAELEAMTPEQRAEHDAGMKEFAAMLQGADGNHPVIPDGWVACSERLPENKPGSYEYLVFESLNNGVHHDYWNVPDSGDDCQFTPFWNHYDRYVTHWMPLPAAPQQEVKNV